MKSLLLSRSCVKPLRFPHFEFFKFNNPMNPGNEQRRDQYEAVNASKIRFILACQARLSLFAGSKSPVLRIL